MTNIPKLSRRDWFRLRLPHQDQRLADEARSFSAVGTNEARSGLRAIKHPPNHDGMNLQDLPPLREAMLTDEEVVALLTDIRNNGSEIQLMQKRGAKSHETVDLESFDAAKKMFLNGQIQRLQIRYQWQGSLWIDTLGRQQTAVRLVRVSHQSQ